MNPEDVCECCSKKKAITCKTCNAKKTMTEFDHGRKSCKVCRKNYNAKQYQIRKDKEYVENLNLKN